MLAESAWCMSLRYTLANICGSILLTLNHVSNKYISCYKNTIINNHNNRRSTELFKLKQCQTEFLLRVVHCCI